MSGAITVSSAWEMSDAVVNAQHTQYVFNSGVAQSSVVSSAGLLNVSSGGVAVDTVVSGGSVRVYAGGLGSNIIISDGAAFISSGGVIRDMRLEHTGARFYAHAGGIVASTTVSTGGMGLIDSGSALDITLAGGQLQLRYNSASYASHVVLNGGTLTLYAQDCMATDIILNSGQVVLTPGNCSRITTQSGTNVTVFNGTVEDADLHWILNAAMNASTTSRTFKNIRAYAAYTLQSAFCAAQDITLLTDISNGVSTGHGVWHARGGTISGITVSSGGSLYIGSGGLIENVTLHSGGFISGVSAASAVSRQISAVTIFGGNAAFSSGAQVTDVTVQGGELYMRAGGTLTSATVHRGAVVISPGAVGSNLTISSGANTFYVSSGGTASGVTCDVGVSVISGGSLCGIEAHGFLYASGYVSGANIRANTANVVYTTGSGTDVDVYTTFSVWGHVTDVRVHSGRLTLDHGGVGSGIVLYSGTTLVVVSACSALAVTSNTGARVIVSAGGYIEYVTP